MTTPHRFTPLLLLALLLAGCSKPNAPFGGGYGGMSHPDYTEPPDSSFIADQHAEPLNLRGQQSPVDPLSHQRPWVISPETRLSTLTIRAPKHVKFVQGARITIEKVPPEDAEPYTTMKGATCVRYGRLVVGGTVNRYNGHEYGGGPMAARIKPKSVELWFPGPGPGTLIVTVGDQRFEFVSTGQWREEAVPGIDQCIAVDCDHATAEPCEVEP